MRTLFGLGSSLLVTLALLAGCGDSVPESKVNEGTGSGAMNGNGASNGSGANGSGASSSGGSITNAAGSLNLGGGLSDGGSNGLPSGGAGNETCASASQQAELAPVYLVFLLDESGSMGDGKNGDRTKKWDPVTSALNAFFADPMSAGLMASLSLFPLNKNTTSGAADSRLAADCKASAYGTPEVPPRALPDATTFKDAIAKLDPPNEHGTPTYPALVGTIAYAESLIAEDPSRKVAIVMVTDGNPQSCSAEGNTIANTATAAEAVADHLPTYVIGVGDELQSLKAIAQAGGTKDAFIVSVAEPARTREQLLEAVNLIRGQSISCELPIPAPPVGKKLDPNKVNVHLTANGQPDASLAYGTECTGATAWHYDDPAKPTKVLLCEDTCAAVKADPMAKLAVEFACVDRVAVVQ